MSKQGEPGNADGPLELRLVVLNDLHVHPDWSSYSDVNTPARLEQAIDRVNASYADADLVIVNGDIAHRGHDEGYRLAQTQLARLLPPVWFGLGNHDRRYGFVRVFGAEHLPGGFAQRAGRFKNHGIILLDTNGGGNLPDSPKVDRGTLCGTRLAWFRRQLRAFVDLPVIVVMHHPALPLLLTADRDSLAEADEFLFALEEHGNVRQVIGAHVHLTCSSVRNGIVFVTCSGGYQTTAGDHGKSGVANEFRSPVGAQFLVLLGMPGQITTHFISYA